MRDEISNYIPTPEDLDYPAKLEQIAAAATANTTEGTGAGSVRGRARTRTGMRMQAGTRPWRAPWRASRSCTAAWTPTSSQGWHRRRCQCARTPSSAQGKVISRKASPTDRALFLIKHLLILREQIAPFDVEFAVTIKELDFAHTLDHVRPRAAGQASFLSLTSGANLARLSPRVTESQVDSKRELEKTLKATCEQFIMSATKTTVEPFLSFITKVTAVTGVQQQQLPRRARGQHLKRDHAKGGQPEHPRAGPAPRGTRAWREGPGGLKPSPLLRKWQKWFSK